MFKFKITCDQATTICDRSQYGESSLLEIIKLRLHFLQCSICSLYTKQNNLITQISNKSKLKNAICNMTKEEKELIRKKMQEL